MIFCLLVFLPYLCSNNATILLFFSDIFNFFFAISLTKRAIFTTMFTKSEKSTKKAENLKFRSQSNVFSFTKMFAM